MSAKFTRCTRTAELVAIALAWLLAAPAALSQVEPSGPHPRLFSDPATMSGLKERASVRGSFVARTIARCQELTNSPDRFANDLYMGLDWAQYLQTCLIAWRATDREAYAKTALRYFAALIDDLKLVGDGQGGDKAATRDSGYAIRAHGPYAALAYDWLHDYRGVDPALLARARQRFKAWVDWYLVNGYRARSPGTNYNAGYVFAATLIAIAQGGEAGPEGARLWRHVTTELFNHDLLPAAASGVLRGGDWGEGWQYAPLSVASYALAARAVEERGFDVAPLRSWLRDVAQRHVYALTPGGDATYAGGDTQAETANLPVRRETLAAVVAGPAPEEARQWAQAELDRLDPWLEPPGFSLFGALADAARVRGVPYPRATSRRGYIPAGTSTLYWRTSWKPSAVWFVAPCSRQIDVDHWHPDAGNFVLSRGDDDLIVDPSPYGSLSSLTSNAPTMDSSVLPASYLPSQAFWGVTTGFRWTKQFSGGELLVRCDYADQYRIQETASDVPYAIRDFVVLPYEDAVRGESAAVLIVDRARRRDSAGSLSLRFRSPATFGSGGVADGVQGSVGGSRISVSTLWRTGGNGEVRALAAGGCFTEQYTRGNCDAARLPVSERRLIVPGPTPGAVHLVEASPQRGDAPLAPVVLSAEGGRVWQLRRGLGNWTIGMLAGRDPLRFHGSPGRYFLLPAEVVGAAGLNVEVRTAGSGCQITVGGADGQPVAGNPAAFDVDAACRLSAPLLVDFAGR